MRANVALVDLPFESKIDPQTQTHPLTLTHHAVIVLLGAISLAVCAKVSIPAVPVPFTLQTLGLFVIGAAFGQRRGVAAVALYLAAGLCGAPVFSPTTVPGPAAFVGPSAGFLYGFVPTVAVIGFLADRGWDRNFGRTAVAMFLGTAVLFACGTAWLAVGMGIADATSAMVPYLPAAAIKMVAATAILPLAWRLVGRR